MAQLILKSKLNPNFSIAIDHRVISNCSIFENIINFAHGSDPVEVEMTEQQLKDFVGFHEHFTSSTASKDMEWTIAFFAKMSDHEFKSLCKSADIYDSQRFIEGAGDFCIQKFQDMEVKEIQEYLNVVDDYTVQDRIAMDSQPLTFFKRLYFVDSDIQQIPLPLSIIEYILLNSNSNLLKKLHETCKVIFSFNPCCLVDVIKSEPGVLSVQRRKESLSMNHEQLQQFKDFGVIKEIIIKGNNPVAGIFLSKMHDCVATRVDLKDFTMSKKTFLSLVKSGNVKYFTCKNCIFNDCNDNKLYFEEMLEYLLNAVILCVKGSVKFSPTSLNAVNNFKWQKKIGRLILSDLGEPLNAKLLFEFFEKCLDSNAKVWLCFLNAAHAPTSFKETIERKVNEWNANGNQLRVVINA